jgi:hypothetical protein
LEGAIYEWLAHWNDEPKPFIWRVTADVILEKVRRSKNQMGRHTSAPATSQKQVGGKGF